MCSVYCTHCRGWARSASIHCSKDLDSMKVFRERFLKTGWGRGVVRCVTSSWTFFWLPGGEESASSTFWFQLLWGLPAYRQHTDNFPPAGGFSIFKTARRTWLQGLSTVFVLCLSLVAQTCPTLCNPVDCSLPGSSVHGDSPGKNTGVGCYALL